LTSPIKTLTPVLKISTYIITSITAHPVRLTTILEIMSPSKLPLFYILSFFLWSRQVIFSVSMNRLQYWKLSISVTSNKSWR